MYLEFMECDSCSKQAGSPPLCGGCLNNRYLIEILQKDIKQQNKTISIIEDVVKLQRMIK